MKKDTEVSENSLLVQHSWRISNGSYACSRGL